jgi:hypothetical protein
MPDRDRGTLGIHFRELELRDPLRDRVVQLKRSGVAQLQNRVCREGLRDRGDAIGGGRRGGDFLLEVGVAVALRPDELLVVDDGDRNARLLAISRRPVGPGVENLEGCGDFGFLRQRNVGGRERRGGGENEESGDTDRDSAGTRHSETSFFSCGILEAVGL